MLYVRTTNKKETINLKKSKKEYMESFRGKKEESKMLSLY